MLQTFRYKAKDQKGEVMTGFVQAVSKDAASKILTQNALMPLEVEVPKDIFDYITFGKKVSLKDKSMLARQLATMINAGLPLTQAISILLKQTKNKKLFNILSEILQDIEAGYSFSTSLNKFPDVFNRIFVNAVRAGEATGKLEEVLLELADNLEKDQGLSAKIKGALFYPAFILIAMIGVAIFMMIKVIPTLTGIFEESGQQLPWTTRILIFCSKALINYWYIIIVLVVIIVIAIRVFLKSKVGMLFMAKLQINTPLIKTISQQSIMARMSRTLAMLVGAGVPLVESIRIVAESMTNQLYRDAIEATAYDVERGIPMSVPVGKNNLFPVLVGQMLAVGEQTGKMSEILGKLADFYDSETNEQVKGISSLVEPVIMIIIGIGVAILVFSILIPIYQIAQFV